MLRLGGHQIEVHREIIDVTRLSRPDTTWAHVDQAGHQHHWEPQGPYCPETPYSVPTLEWVVDTPGTDEEPELGHYQCRVCHAPVTPGRTADNTRRFIKGPSSFIVDGHPTSREDLVQLLEQAGEHEAAAALQDTSA